MQTATILVVIHLKSKQLHYYIINTCTTSCSWCFEASTCGRCKENYWNTSNLDKFRNWRLNMLNGWVRTESAKFRVKSWYDIISHTLSSVKTTSRQSQKLRIQWTESSAYNLHISHLKNVSVRWIRFFVCHPIKSQACIKQRKIKHTRIYNNQILV